MYIVLLCRGIITTGKRTTVLTVLRQEEDI